MWNTLTAVAIADFTAPLQQVKVLMTYFIPDTSGDVRLEISQANGATSAPEASLYILTTIEVQYNFTLTTPSLLSAVNRIIITLTAGTIAIYKLGLATHVWLGRVC